MECDCCGWRETGQDLYFKYDLVFVMTGEREEQNDTRRVFRFRSTSRSQNLQRQYDAMW
jgi:hypothetical protein